LVCNTADIHPVEKKNFRDEKNFSKVKNFR